MGRSVSELDGDMLGRFCVLCVEICVGVVALVVVVVFTIVVGGEIFNASLLLTLISRVVSVGTILSSANYQRVNKGLPRQKTSVFGNSKCSR